VARQEADKREFSRVEVECEVVVTEEGQPQRYRGIARNLSGRGVMVSMDRPFALGTRLELHIAPLHPTTPPLDAVVEVVRVEEKRGKGYDIGGVIREVRDLLGVIPDDHAAT
jgi:hypothetical protein